MKKRFSSYLLMGKVATLPAVTSKVMAANPPDYNDLTAPNVTAVTLPSNGHVMLTSTSYGNVPTICVNHGVPATMSVVVTGINPGDTVYLAASINSNDPAYTQLSPNLLIGTKDLVIIDSFVNSQTTIRSDAMVGSQLSSTKFNVDLSKLTSAGIALTDNSEFFMQAMIVPQSAVPLAGAAYWNALRYSPLVTVKADAGRTPYGTCYGY
jgi:hypothetical protein